MPNHGDGCFVAVQGKGGGILGRSGARVLILKFTAKNPAVRAGLGSYWRESDYEGGE